MKAIKGVIFDIDGVLEYQGQAIPGASQTVEWLRQRGVRLRFLTNSTLKSCQSAAEKLRKKGFDISTEEVITASYAASVYLRQVQPRSCWVMLEREGLDEFADIPQDMQNPEIIVVGDNRSRFDFDHLNQALRLLCKGARLVGMQAEMLDSSTGELELNVGAWVHLLEAASGVQATYTGKPSPFAFELTLRSMGLEKDAVIMVGDRVLTDVLGARNFGLRSVLVKTGEYRPGDLESGPQPDYAIASIADLPGILPDLVLPVPGVG